MSTDASCRATPRADGAVSFTSEAASERSGRVHVAILVGALVMLGAVPLDVMLPSFPALAQRFGSSIQGMSLSVSVFSAAFALAQLFAGPLSDRIGRRRLLVTALAVASAATVGMLFVRSFAALLTLRALQGVGCSAFVLAQAIVQDEFKGQDALRARVLMTTGNGLFIATAPLCGDLLQRLAGWRGSFLLFLAIAIAIAAASTRYREHAVRQGGGVRFYCGEYRRLFADGKFVGHWFIGSMAFSSHFAFIVASPLIFMDALRMGSSAYSLVLLAYGVAYLAGGIATSWLIARLDRRTAVMGGLGLIGLAGAALVLLVQACGLSAPAVLGPMVMCTFGTTIVRSHAVSAAMSRSKRSAGTASAAGGAIRMFVGGASSALVTSFRGETIAALGTLLLFTGLFCAALLVHLDRTAADDGSPESVSG
jgi:predicted MFS family arabinose efflux permease